MRLETKLSKVLRDLNNLAYTPAPYNPNETVNKKIVRFYALYHEYEKLQGRYRKQFGNDWNPGRRVR